MTKVRRVVIQSVAAVYLTSSLLIREEYNNPAAATTAARVRSISEITRTATSSPPSPADTQDRAESFQICHVRDLPKA